MSYYERNLPHWHPENRAVFITWRLYGSLPRTMVQGLAAGELESGRQFAEFDRMLEEARYGPLWLKDPVIADFVVGTLRKGQDELNQYTLQGYVVMANHVHLLIQPRIPLARIMKGIKGVTARQANKILGRAGKLFWQDESFDHWARDRVEEERIRTYIEGNPVRAGLVTRPADWPWSSARK